MQSNVILTKDIWSMIIPHLSADKVSYMALLSMAKSKFLVHPLHRFIAGLRLYVQMVNNKHFRYFLIDVLRNSKCFKKLYKDKCPVMEKMLIEACLIANKMMFDYCADSKCHVNLDKITGSARASGDIEFAKYVIERYAVPMDTDTILIVSACHAKSTPKEIELWQVLCNNNTTPYREMIESACANCSLEVVKFMCSKMKFAYNEDLLEYAAKNPDLEVVKFIYDYNESCNSTSAFKFACRENKNVEVVRWLYENISVNCHSNEIFQEACAGGILENMKFIYEVFLPEGNFVTCITSSWNLQTLKFVESVSTGFDWEDVLSKQPEISDAEILDYVSTKPNKRKQEILDLVSTCPPLKTFTDKHTDVDMNALACILKDPKLKSFIEKTSAYDENLIKILLKSSVTKPSSIYTDVKIDWNYWISHACANRYHPMIKLAKSKGATQCRCEIALEFH